MKKSLTLLLVFIIFVSGAIAQRPEIFDIATFTPPKGWEKKTGTDGVQFSTEDKEKGTYCLITLFRSVPSLGTSRENFGAAWNTIVKEAVNVSSTPTMYPSNNPEDWALEGGFAPFEKDGVKGVAMLYTISGYGKMMNAMILTNGQTYEHEITAFLESFSFKKPEIEKQSQLPTGANGSVRARKSGFKFTENRFNDGWTAIEQDDWVRVTKGSSTVLIHYALPDIRGFNNLDEASASVWNNIVAPRYSDLKNFFSRRSWYADGDFMNGKYFVEGDVTDPAMGKRVYVALFKNGTAGKWIEFIMPDKQSFQREFTTVYVQDGTNWDKLSAMIGYNKFAVAAEDLAGVWKSSSAAGIELYNIYTGNSVGMATTSSSNEFTFSANGGYTEIYKSASGVGAGLNYYGQTNKGRFTVSPGSMLTLTNRFKGQAHEFSAYFEAVKGGRILHLYRGSIEELHLYKAR